MRRIRAASCSIVALGLGAIAPGAAGATMVTVGATGTTSVAPAQVGSPATIFNTTLAEPGALVTSPLSGTIVRWHVTGFTGGPWRLQVLTPLGGLSYFGGGRSAPELPSSTATQTYATSIPIKAGQTIAVENANGSDEIGAIVAPAGSYSFFTPALAENASSTALAIDPGVEFAYNAEVLPPPAISAISPAKGSFKGGSTVTVSGANFADVSGVSFGGVPATSFSVASESQLTAVAPASAKPQSVGVTVTTVAGSATSAQPFTYAACRVPSLVGKKLKGAKKRIRKAGCKVGEVTKEKGVSAKTGHVVKQAPKPGKLLAPGAKVKLTLG